MYVGTEGECVRKQITGRVESIGCVQRWHSATPRSTRRHSYTYGPESSDVPPSQYQPGEIARPPASPHRAPRLRQSLCAN